MEHLDNIGPRYAIRLGDLRAWHRITARCLRCGHTHAFPADFLAWERPAHARLTELEPKLRCTRCGNRAGNTLSVTRVERN